MLIFYGQGLNFDRCEEKKSRMYDRAEGTDAVAGGSVHEPFRFYRPADPSLPLLLSVPHAGRYYPVKECARSAVPLNALSRLEDRHADALIADLIEQGYGAVVATVARAVIDLNRDPRDIDRRMIAGMPHGYAVIETAKSRGGLGLFPRSLPRIGPLWRGSLPWAHAEVRIATIHAPYHARLEHEMRRIRDAHGQVLLLDVHSMPPLERERFAPGQRPDVVIGDRFGASASPRLAEIARSVCMRHGCVAAINHPYPGGYIAERHGRPQRGRHAIQIEISRDLYLDERLDSLGPGMGAVCAMMSDLAATLAEELRARDLPVAAE